MHRFLGIIPTPPPLQAQSLVYDLKTRLDWGDPALTIIDVRDRSEYNYSHILGAIPIPLAELARILSTLELTRDIYIYGETDEETALAAKKLQAMGYQNVSQIRGGVAAWKAVGYPIESLVQTLPI
ncbi:rhodanese-like domain-containing protein [Gloeocapsopsis dulcis]|uniref:Rhodanese n=1 Tax=Gloeocapsopsis dulcis AAB1 = 1H9 TaxID=1433147 RepID=A0A6N8FML9_9CHRO|nr:rhodanese-like domain-containing protein [Gloeocapsopsis dulcis]MUL34790.1 rhodanese [Gloeocapsopsis dulcis AAB1 = 1H9]WNN90142.1 rhodanese-like domain-containing protein [Gloeocapsopsis dulcis]